MEEPRGYNPMLALLVALAVFAVSCWIFPASSSEPAIAEIPAVAAVRPPLGAVFHAHVTNVVDGDTLDVACGDYTARIRLLGCWCPETTGPTKDAGLAAKRSMIRLAADKPCYVQIPIGYDVKKSLSLDRFLGRVWVADDEVDLSTHQVRLGHATRTKGR